MSYFRHNPTRIIQLTEFLYRDVDVLVIGMGPTGLGAAKRLNQIVRTVMIEPID